jgi:choline oxidase
VAARLAEWLDTHVILVEAGASDEGDPTALRMSRLEQQDTSLDWGYSATTTPQAFSPIAYARAKMLGGCGNHNDCAFIAPPAHDLDRWATLGADGWNHASLEAALRRVAARTRIEPAPPGNRLSRAFIDAATALGLPERNFRDGVAAGAGWFPLNAAGDFRQSSSVGYLHPLEALPGNLEILTETFVSRINIIEARCVSADTSRGLIAARREIILCAGSINTPQLMMLSGLGPAAQLLSHGIEVIRDLPGVGANLVDHVAANIAMELQNEPPVWARTPCEATALMQVDQGQALPDVLFHFVLRLREKFAGRRQFGGVTHGVKISPNVARPRSRGTVTLASADPHDRPAIDLNFLSDSEGHDARILLAGLRFARRLARTAPLSDWLGREIAPGPDFQSDEELTAYMRESCETVYHPAGTCRMGAPADAMAVVGPDLKVKGVDGLRIADASVFPDMVTVNTNNTVMMVAEHAAALIAKLQSKLSPG